MLKEIGLEEPKPDWTWDEFLYTAKTLTREVNGKKVFGFGIPYFNFGMTPWWYTNNTSYLTDDWKNSNVNDVKMEESMTFLHSLLHCLACGDTGRDGQEMGGRGHAEHAENGAGTATHGKGVGGKSAQAATPRRSEGVLRRCQPAGPCR